MTFGSSSMIIMFHTIPVRGEVTLTWLSTGNDREYFIPRPVLASSPIYSSDKKSHSLFSSPSICIGSSLLLSSFILFMLSSGIPLI